jgi:hypothetical protein
MNPITVIKEWLTRVQRPRSELNGKSICPFAKMPEIIVVKQLTSETVIPTSQSITIYIEDSVNSSFEDIDAVCRDLRSKHNNCIFLPDHPEKKNYINGIETGNGYLPLIIVQNSNELLSARRKLEKTDYYDKWDKKYLEDVKSYGD